MLSLQVANNNLSLAKQAELLLLLRQRGLAQQLASPWKGGAYVNSERGHTYQPHHRAESLALKADSPRYVLVKGGEGGGKSTMAIMKSLERLRRGCSGLMVSPDLPHFRKSLWPEFVRWCPWDEVIPEHQHRRNTSWEPHTDFRLVFKNGAWLYCGGLSRDAMSWEGPNANFAHFDEARRYHNAEAIKMLDGRVRIPGPHGEPSQIWLATTPRKNWLFDFFGPLKVRCRSCSQGGQGFEIGIDTHLLPGSESNRLYNYRSILSDSRCPHCGSDQLEVTDEWASFKLDSLVVVLLTSENEPNLEDDFAAKRRQTLTEKEAAVRLSAAWEDDEDGEPFLPDMTLWDALFDPALPKLTEREPLVIALDAGISGDSFGMLGVRRHPKDRKRIALGFAKEWRPPAGGKIHFQGSELSPGPERFLRLICKRYSITCVVYDPWQLHDMATRLGAMGEGLAWFESFSQTNKRLEADKALYDSILSRGFAHSGEENIRTCIANAGRVTNLDRSIRLVKITNSRKIDLAVCLSMARYKAQELNL